MFSFKVVRMNCKRDIESLLAHVTYTMVILYYCIYKEQHDVS